MSDFTADVSAAAPDERAEVEQERDDRRAWMRAALDLQAVVRRERARADTAEAALAARPAPVVSGEAVERAAQALYVRTARDNVTHDEAVVPWSSLRSDIRSRWLDYASDALTAALGITVADAPAADDEGGGDERR